MTMSNGAQLLYLMDPQCGWCFGFSGTIHEIVAHYRTDERLKLTLITGGLFHPAMATRSKFAEEKRPIAAQVSRQFGVRFSEDYFRNILASGNLDSLVPCQIINAVKITSPESAFGFAERLIDAAFTEGRNISELPVCLDVVQEGSLKREEVESILLTPEVGMLTEESFEFARRVGTGFPSLYLKTERGLIHLGGTQLDLKTLKAEVDAQLNSVGTSAIIKKY